jgi:tetratricopeptide (TPR) repeat protein
MSMQTSESLAEIRVANNPFPGLRPFEFDESHLFFGRDGQSEQLIGKLSRTHFLAVVGTSGSGKSSLVRAGFLPALQGGFMTSAGSAWRVAIMRPGNDPLGNLARALNARAVFGSEFEENTDIQIAIAESTLRRGSLGLVDAVRQAVLAGDENLLVVVDQFEEIFRFARIAEGAEYGNDAAAFIKLLLEASAQREVPIYVVLTMRSDYLGDCSQFWGLPEAINESQYLIPRLTRDQLREAITGPGAVGGGKITPRLVNRLLNDVGDNQDQLPVLQHLLMRAWNEWKDQRLEVEPGEGESVNRPHKNVHQGDAIDLCCAEAVGGMAHALSRHADEAYHELPDDHHREVAEKLFKALTEKGPDNREIRRPITLGEISSITGARQSEVITVIEAFRQPGRSFLMAPAPAALNSESLVDISHESLIRGWARLTEWVDEEARSARIYRRLAETAVLYKEGGAGLWRDPDLQIALTWREQGKPNEVWARRYHPEFALAERFLDESVADRDAQVIKDEAQRRKEINRTRLTALIFGVAFLFSLAMGVYAYGAKNKAETAQIEAVKAKNDALAQKKVADQAKDDALAQKKVADDAKDDAFAQKAKADEAKNDALAQKKKADEAKNDALAQKKTADKAKNEALAQKDLATAEALKGQALGALKEQDQDTAIQLFKDLEKLYRQKANPGGVSYALSSMADIHRDRAPVGLFASMSQGGSGSGPFADIDEDESQFVKQYYQAILTMQAFATESGDDVAKEELMKEAGRAVDLYKLALDANKDNRGDDRSLKEGNILRNLGDLQIGMAEMNRELADTAEKKEIEQQTEAGIQKGVEYYREARVAYKAAGLHEKEGDVLKKAGDVLLKNLFKKPDPKPADATADANQAPAPPDPKELAEFDSVVSYYDQAGDAFKLGKKPLLQAGVLNRIGDLYQALAEGSPEKAYNAVRYYDEAREIYRRAQGFRQEALVNDKLGKLYEDLQDNDKALRLYKEAFAAYHKASLDPKRKSESLTGEGEMFKKAGELLFKSGGKIEANRFFEEGLSLNTEAEGKVRLLTTIAEFYKAKEDDAEAIKYHERKRDTWRAAGNFLEEGNTLYVIGNMQKDAHEDAAAASSFDDARAAYRRVSEKERSKSYILSQNLIAIASFYLERDKQKAVSTYEEVLQVEMQQPSSYQINQILQAEGGILLGLKTPEASSKARQLVEKILTYHQSKNNKDAEAVSLSAAGDLYASAGETGEARNYYDRVRAIYVAGKNTYQLGILLKKIGGLEIAEHPETTLFDYYQREAESADRNGDLLLQAVALEAAAFAYKEKKENQKAIDYFERTLAAYHGMRLTSQEMNTLRNISFTYTDMGNKEKAEEFRKRADELNKLIH